MKPVKGALGFVLCSEPKLDDEFAMAEAFMGAAIHNERDLKIGFAGLVAEAIVFNLDVPNWRPIHDLEYRKMCSRAKRLTGNPTDDEDKKLIDNAWLATLELLLRPRIWRGVKAIEKALKRDKVLFGPDARRIFLAARDRNDSRPVRSR